MNDNASVGKLKFFAILALSLVICGCGAPAQPDEVAKDFLYAILTLDAPKANKLSAKERSSSCQIEVEIIETLADAVDEANDEEETLNLKEHKRFFDKATFSAEIQGGDNSRQEVDVTIVFADEESNSETVSVELLKEGGKWKVYDFALDAIDMISLIESPYSD